jgi:hypothetical protein
MVKRASEKKTSDPTEDAIVVAMWSTPIAGRQMKPHSHCTAQVDKRRGPRSIDGGINNAARFQATM